MELISINPATGEQINEYLIDSDEVIDDKVKNAQIGFLTHRQLSYAERKTKFLRLGKILHLEIDALSSKITSEMGKLTKESVAEIEKCALICEYYAEKGEEFLAKEERASGGTNSYIRYEPLGVLLAVMPWNYPFWQVFRFAVPAIMAGNTVLLKHASNVTGSALEMQRVFELAGFSDNEFQTLVIPSSKVKNVIEHELVKAVSLTGSEYAGSQVASIAAKHIKKAVLELGGSDPFIVFADANLEIASSEAISARFMNCGQSCIAGKRFLIEQPIYEEFLALFKSKMDALLQGNPKENVTIGPMASSKLADELEKQVRQSIEMGAKLYGGKRKGYAYFSPGILTEIPENAVAYKEELFGPIASFYSFETKEDAVKIANHTKFGLGSSVWSSNQELINFMIDKIEAGCVFINSMVKSDPHLPFGGIKKSGYGRELSKEGIREFVNVKTVFIK